jgi:hypothetical protein
LKISEANKGRESAMKGKSHDLKTKRRISESMKKVMKSAEERLSRGKGWRGKKRSMETREKMSESARRAWFKRKEKNHEDLEV